MRQYENRFIAFIDILGFKDIIKKTSNNTKLQEKIYSILDYNTKVMERNYGDTFENMNELGVEITVFSDSIVISYPEIFPGSLFHLLMDCVYISNDLLSNGVFIRGGITHGQLIHKKTICFGPAMVEAHELESQKAIYPRIIISNNAIKKGILYHGNANSFEMEKQYIKGLISKESDEIFFLDFLSQEQEFDEFMYESFLDSVRVHIIHNIKHNNNEHILKKYIWFKKYYNNVVSGMNLSKLLIS